MITKEDIEDVKFKIAQDLDNVLGDILTPGVKREVSKFILGRFAPLEEKQAKFQAAFNKLANVMDKYL